MPGPGEKEPLHRLSKADRGAIIIIVAYTWIVIATIVTGIRFGLAWTTKTGFKLEDGTFALGVVSDLLTLYYFSC
jgi:hypothetical protein